jgi:hypothetical protein
MRRRLAVLPATVSALLLLASPAAALGTLDQEQTSADNAHAAAGAVQVAQLFTAGLTGQLDHVDLHLSTGLGLGPGPGGPLGDDLTVEIWTVTSGAPDGPVPGASATVLRADVPHGPPLWVQVPISAPSVAGTQYAIVLSAPAASLGDCPDFCWQWLFDDGSDLYAGGELVTSFDSGANWAPQEAGWDAAFRTYVTPPAPPTPQASLLNAATAAPSPVQPLATLGFGLLLVGALGGLALVNVRSRSR